jgi:hypothetical protein
VLSLPWSSRSGGSDSLRLIERTGPWENSPEQSLVDSMANSSRTRVGLGQATADAFAKEGPDVVATDLHDKDGAEQTRARPARLVDAVSAGRF